MSSDIVEPPPGLPDSEGTPAGFPGAEASRSEKPPPDVSGPDATPIPEGTASVDDLGLSLGEVRPDPFLDAYHPDATGSGSPDLYAAGAGGDLGSSPDDATTQPEGPISQASSWSTLDIDVPPSAEPPTVAKPPGDSSSDVSAPDLTPGPAPVPSMVTYAEFPAPESTSGHFPGVDLSAPPSAHDVPATSRRKAKVETKAKAEAEAEDEEIEDWDGPPRGSSLPMALLASYASAVTIGLLWVLWGNRHPRESVEADPFPPAESAPDPGHRASESRKVVPLTPVPADHITGMGQTLRLGSLEVTPLEVTAGPVTLVREINKGEARKGGEDALQLKLRLKNVASDSILIPLDEAFLRERGRGIRDSFLEAGPGVPIAMFPLAIVSEWSIVGQDFRELRPGESYDPLVVTAPDALAHIVPEMTWRIRLRTDVNQTEVLGVRFGEKDVRRGPARVEEAR